MMISSDVSEIIIEGKHAAYRKISKVNLIHTMEQLSAYDLLRGKGIILDHK